MPFLGQLPLDVLVAVDAQLGVVGEVGAELEEERAEVLVEAVEVELVDHRRRLLTIQGYFLPVCGSVPLLGAEDRQFSLGPCRGTGRLRFPENARRYSAATSSLRWPLRNGTTGIWCCSTKASTCRQEALVMTPISAEEANRLTAMEAEEASRLLFRLQFRLIDVEVHAIDAFDFQSHVIGDDIGNAARYTHDWLRSTPMPFGTTTALSGPTLRLRSRPRRSTGAFLLSQRKHASSV